MFYTIKKQFDAAIESLGIPVNQYDVANTDDVQDEIQGFSRISDIRQAEEQTAEHIDFNFTYTFQFVRGSSDVSDTGIEARNIQAQKDYLDVVSKLNQTISASEAINATQEDGEYDDVTKKEYQSWGVMSVRVHFRHNVCAPIVR